MKESNIEDNIINNAKDINIINPLNENTYSNLKIKENDQKNSIENIKGDEIKNKEFKPEEQSATLMTQIQFLDNKRNQGALFELNKSLEKTDDTSKNSTDMESFKANLEKDTAKKVSNVLEKIVGKGNVSVQVNADIDFNSAKATIESYKPLNDEKGTGVITSSQTEVETYENPNNLANNNGVNLTPAVIQNRNLNYSKQKTAINYSVTKEVKQVIYAPGSVKRLSIAVAVNKVLTDAEKDEIKNLVLSASGVDYSRGDVISVSGLQFEGATIDKKHQDNFVEQYKQDQILEFVSTSVIPLIVILILGSFALLVLKGFISKMPTPKKAEPRPHENIQEVYQEEIEESGGENTPKIEINKKELRSQKDQSINELNEAIMASPEEAAKLITSFIKN